MTSINQYRDIQLIFQNGMLLVEDYFNEFDNLFVLEKKPQKQQDEFEFSLKQFDTPNNQLHFNDEIIQNDNQNIKPLILNEQAELIFTDSLNGHYTETTNSSLPDNQSAIKPIEKTETISKNAIETPNTESKSIESNHVETNHSISEEKKNSGNWLKLSLLGLATILTSGAVYQFTKNYNMNNMWDINKLINNSPYSWCPALNKTNEHRIMEICSIPSQAQSLDKDFSNSYNLFFSLRKNVSLENIDINKKAQTIIQEFVKLKTDVNSRPTFSNTNLQQSANNLYQIIETNNLLTIKQAQELQQKINNLKQQDNALLAQQTFNNTIVAQLEDGSLVNATGQVFTPQGQLIGTVTPEILAQLQQQQNANTNASMVSNNPANVATQNPTQNKTPNVAQQNVTQQKSTAAKPIITNNGKQTGNNVNNKVNQNMIQAQIGGKAPATSGKSVQQIVQQQINNKKQNAAQLPRQNQSIAAPSNQEYEYIEYIIPNDNLNAQTLAAQQINNSSNGKDSLQVLTFPNKKKTQTTQSQSFEKKDTTKAKMNNIEENESDKTEITESKAEVNERIKNNRNSRYHSQKKNNINEEEETIE